MLDSLEVLSVNGRKGNVVIGPGDIPIATSFGVGGVKVGSVTVSNITLAGDGSLSVPLATSAQAGVVTVAAQATSNLVLSGGALSVPLATATTPGVLSVPAGGGLTLNAGVLSANVITVAGRTGAVTLAVADVSGAAPLASPALTGVPTAPTANPGTNTTQIATTAFAQGLFASGVTSFNNRTGPVLLTATDLPIATATTIGAMSVPAGGGLTLTAGALSANMLSVAGRTGAVTLTVADVSGAAPIASPTFTGTPAAPTATPGTSTTQIATTAFVGAAISALPPFVTSFNTRTGAITLLSSDLPIATTSVVGAVKAGMNLTVAGDGTLSVPTATNSVQGVASFGAGLTVTGGSVTANVTTVAGRTGDVVLGVADVSGAAPLASPALTGVPTAPTATAGTSTTQIATTQFVINQINAISAGVTSFNGRSGSVTLQSSDLPLATTTVVGGVKAGTNLAVAGDGTLSVATATSSVQGVASFGTGLTVTAGVVTANVVTVAGRTGSVTLTVSDVSGAAPLASPALTGTPTAPTATAGTNTTQIATTAFVTSAIGSLAPGGVTSFNTRTGAITLTTADVTNAGGAPIASPAFTGNPTAPTQTSTDNSTNIATTAFVGTAINNLSTTLAGPTGASLVGFLASGSAALLRPIQSVLRDTVNARNYGILGNGSTDDTSKINTLLAALQTAGSVVDVYFPGGNYILSGSGVSGNQYIGRIRGDGPAATVFTMSSGTGPAFTFSSTADGITFQDVGIFGPGQGASSGQDGVVISNGGSPIRQPRFVNCEIYNWPGKALNLNTPIAGSAHNCRFQNNIHGVYINSGTSFTFYNCYPNGNKKAGYWLNGTTYSTFTGCAADSNGIAYLLSGLTAVTLVGCGNEAGTANNLTITNSSLTSNVATFTYSGPDQSADFIGNGRTVVIQGSTNIPAANAGASGLGDGRWYVASVGTNTVSINLTSANISSAADTGTCSFWAGDGIVCNGSTVIQVVGHRTIAPAQTSSSMIVTEGSANQITLTGMRSTQGSGSLQIIDMWLGTGTANIIRSNNAFSGGTYSGANNISTISNGTWTLPTVTAVNALNTNGTLTLTTAASATSGANNNSPIVSLVGTYWNGSASAQDTVQIQAKPATGANPLISLNFQHSSGSSGGMQLSVNGNPIVSGGGQFIGSGGISTTGNAVIGGTLNVTGSATLGGTPTAPTATPGTNTTQIATTAFVQAAIPAAGTIPYDMPMFLPGVMTNSQLLSRIIFTRAITFPINLTATQCSARVAATASTTLTLNKNGTSIGTLVFAASGTTPTITFSAAVSFAAGDILTITGPATADATLADVSLTIAAFR